MKVLMVNGSPVATGCIATAFAIAKEEFEALEKKFAHNLDREMDRRKADICRLMSQEVIKRYHYQAGKVEDAIRDDEDIKAALRVLHDESEYKKILNK